MSRINISDNPFLLSALQNRILNVKWNSSVFEGPYEGTSTTECRRVPASGWAWTRERSPALAGGRLDSGIC